MQTNYNFIFIWEMKAKAFVPDGMGGWMAMTIHITPTLLGGTGKGLMRRPKSLFNG